MPKLSAPLSNFSRCSRKNLNLSNIPIHRQLLPKVLSDRVRGQKERAQATCTAELQSVLSCWERNEFEMTPCQNQISSFQKCFQNMEASIKERKEADSKGLIVNEEYNLSRKQVNTLLRKNPQIRPQDLFKNLEFNSKRSS